MYYKGQTVYRGNHPGVVVRMFGRTSVQVRTEREKLVTEGFPERVTGTERRIVTETWPVSKVTAQRAAVSGATWAK